MSGRETLNVLVGDAHDQAIDALRLCQRALEQMPELNDLRIQVERARDMLHEAQESLYFVFINTEDTAASPVGRAGGEPPE